MKRKLIKVGTSAAILVPKAVLEENAVKIGDMVEVDVTKVGRAKKKPVIEPEVLAWTEKLMKRYEPALKKLANS